MKNETRHPMRAGINAVPFTVSAWEEELFGLPEALIPETIRIGEALRQRFAPDLVEWAFRNNAIVDAFGVPYHPETRVKPGESIYIFRPVPDEPETSIRLTVLAEGEGWVAVDKPCGIATTPKGSFVARSLVVAARRQWQNDDIVAAHRLDRLTSGVILLVTDRDRRAAYQKLFESGQVRKTYEALAPMGAEGLVKVGDRIRSDIRIVKRSGSLAVDVEGGEANSVTDIELIRVISPEDKCQVDSVGSACAEKYRFLHTAEEYRREGKNRCESYADDSCQHELHYVKNEGLCESASNEERWGVYKLTPHTGKMHQLRATMNHLGVPIIGDPLYPKVCENNAGELECDVPLQLIARQLEFIDPYSGTAHGITSRQALPILLPG
ncbi:pseudouridine synthase [Actinotignum urinale]|uniref:RNA pseudouridylate synthase n=1 Tax=Actinotignum urinale TaxID=190146 RepID=A0AAW9HM41_9ACTO|nr:pseudouridine synthase [Actinotignum urinale]MDY5129006.1 pseudouridine synthase [Actinotignum urinale]MDY5154807.1 pseudouridine synthase [Actinotignum urinale]MDY5159900.1 pseudouridine synthase [Actinotignum urinale]